VELLGLDQVGQWLPEFLVKQEALEGDQAPVVAQVRVLDVVMAVALPGSAKERVLPEVEPGTWRLRLGASGPAAAVEAYKYPMWWRAWREAEASQGRLAVEVEPEEAEAGAASRVRKRFTQF